MNETFPPDVIVQVLFASIGTSDTVALPVVPRHTWRLIKGMIRPVGSMINCWLVDDGSVVWSVSELSDPI